MAVQYHVVNVFDKRGHEFEFVCGISAAFWATCYGTCGARTVLRSTVCQRVYSDVESLNRCLEGWHLLGDTHGAAALQASAGKSWNELARANEELRTVCAHSPVCAVHVHLKPPFLSGCLCGPGAAATALGELGERVFE